MNHITIATHNGGFHTDDLCAVATLSLVLQNKTIDVVRTRDPELIKKADYVVDVGSVYDSDRERFDHHQMGGAGVRDNGVPYASFGLVWKKYGTQITGDPAAAQAIDQKMCQPIDAADNGMDICRVTVDDVFPYTIQSALSAFSPSWKEKDKSNDEVFMELVPFVQRIIEREVVMHTDKIEAEALVIAAYTDAEDKRIVVLDDAYPSGEVLSSLPEPLFVVYPDSQREGQWRIKAVRDTVHSFNNRKDLPEEWAGKEGKDLEDVTGVSGAEFCHRGRFMAVTRSKDAALQLAEIAVGNN